MLNDLYLLNPVFLDDIATTVSEKAGETTIPISDIPDAIRNFPKEKINSGYIKTIIDCNDIFINTIINSGAIKSAIDCNDLYFNPTINSGAIKSTIDCNDIKGSVIINQGKVIIETTLLEV